MKGRRRSPEQVVRKLREAGRLLAEVAEVEDVCRHLEMSIQTYQRWRAQYPEEEWLRGRLRLLARKHPRYGYRKIHVLLRREGWICNRKRVQRLWRDEGLKLPANPRKRRRGRRTGASNTTAPDPTNPPVTRLSARLHGFGGRTNFWRAACFEPRP